MVVKAYGAWGIEASALLSAVVPRLAITSNKPNSVVLKDIYGRLNLMPVRASAAAILSRTIFSMAM